MNITIQSGEHIPEEPQMKLRLVYYATNTVRLMGEDAQGRDWSILDISNNGIHIHRHINTDSGWPIDTEGRLQQK